MDSDVVFSILTICFGSGALLIVAKARNGRFNTNRDIYVEEFLSPIIHSMSDGNDKWHRKMKKLVKKNYTSIPPYILYLYELSIMERKGMKIDKTLMNNEPFESYREMLECTVRVDFRLFRPSATNLLSDMIEIMSPVVNLIAVIGLVMASVLSAFCIVAVLCMGDDIVVKISKEILLIGYLILVLVFVYKIIKTSKDEVYSHDISVIKSTIESRTKSEKERKNKEKILDQNEMTSASSDRYIFGDLLNAKAQK